jgi:hypothetical protein
MSEGARALSKPLCLAIIHTTPVTIEPLASLAAQYMPGCRIVNMMDDSILPQLAENGGSLEDVKERLCTYAVTAESLGADCILNACSSVGGIAAEMGNRVNVPVVRIDDAMAERAVERGRRIGVAATLATTLRPTLALLEAKAAEANKPVLFQPMLAETAYRRLIAGDKDGHDEQLIDALTDLALNTDVVVLAQASMARVVSKLPEPLRERFMTSPALGMERVKQVMEERSLAGCGGEEGKA